MLKVLPRQTEASPNKRSLAQLFHTSKAELKPGTSKYWIRVMLAPICLLMVAGLHWYRVEFRDQTQWKGGGFAMFSTVDSPAARSVRCYLLTEHGEIPVEPPTRLEKWIGEMRAAPARETMPIIAQRLEEATWVRSGHQWRTAEQQIDNLEGSLPARDDRGGTPSVSALGIGEPVPDEAELISIQGVRLELWRYSYDRQQHSITNRRAMNYVHRLEETLAEVKP